MHNEIPVVLKNKQLSLDNINSLAIKCNHSQYYQRNTMQVEHRTLIGHECFWGTLTCDGQVGPTCYVCTCHSFTPGVFVHIITNDS